MGGGWCARATRNCIPCTALPTLVKNPFKLKKLYFLVRYPLLIYRPSKHWTLAPEGESKGEDVSDHPNSELSIRRPDLSTSSADFTTFLQQLFRTEDFEITSVGLSLCGYKKLLEKFLLSLSVCRWITLQRFGSHESPIDGVNKNKCNRCINLHWCLCQFWLRYHFIPPAFDELLRI